MNSTYNQKVSHPPMYLSHMSDHTQVAIYVVILLPGIYSHPEQFGPQGNSDHTPRCILLHGHSLNSFIVPCIELGTWLQGKFDLKRRDEVNQDVCFQVVPYCHCPSSAIRVVFFNLWCPATSALLDCHRFPARDFPKGMEYTVFVLLYFCLVLP